jgi:hypothetical protein
LVSIKNRAIKKMPVCRQQCPDCIPRDLASVGLHELTRLSILWSPILAASQHLEAIRLPSLRL